MAVSAALSNLRLLTTGFLSFILLSESVSAASLTCGLQLGDSRGVYSETACSACQVGFKAVPAGAGGTGTTINNKFPAYGNSFPCNPGLCAGKIAGTILPGSAKFVAGTFCGVCACDGSGGWIPEDLGNRERNVNTCPLPYPAVPSTTFVPGNQVCIPADCTFMAGTTQNLATGDCDCPPGQYWDGLLDTPACRTYDPAQHVCGQNSPGVANWNGGVTGQSPANKKLLCCANGWDTKVLNGHRRDCVETDRVELDDFEKLYNYNCGVPSILGVILPPIPPTDPKYDNILCPNRLYLMQGITYNNQPAAPIPGFYDAKTGTRCPYRSGNNTTQVRIADQLAMFNYAKAKDVLPLKATPFASANSGSIYVSPNCGTLVRLAMEVKCPDPSPSQPSFNWTIGSPAVAVRRCAAAEKIWVHLSLYDLSTADNVNRGRFRPATSYVTDGMMTKKGIEFDAVKVAPITYQKILEQFAPAQCPLPLKGANPPCNNN